MKERPIIFSGESVRQILVGSKTQTRRVIKPQPYIDDCRNFYQPLKKREQKKFARHGLGGHNYGQTIDGKPCLWHFVTECPYGRPGDRLWVREAYNLDFCDEWLYKASCGSAIDAGYSREPKWKPPLYMPRKVSRLTLEIVAVKVEQLQQISDEDSSKECGFSVREFKIIWDGINEKKGFGWDTNPWVWAIEFQEITP